MEPDAFTIASTDSCKPEKCESPHKALQPAAAPISRNGQGTSADPRLAQYEPQLRGSLDRRRLR